MTKPDDPLGPALLGIVSLFAVGCVATTDVLGQWKGAPERELLRRWGEPTSTLASPGGGKIHQYSTTRFVTLPDRLAQGIRGGDQSSTLLFTTHIFSCDFRIEVGPDSKVVAIASRGNDCRPVPRK